ncbi:MAG: lysostaphin resistance A-like protein [Bacilli bacterium]
MMKLAKRDVWRSLLLTFAVSISMSVLLMFVFGPSMEEFLAMLQIDARGLLLASVLTVTIIAMNITCERLFPPAWLDDGGINEAIFKQLTRPELLLVTLCVSVTEEWLFRGIIQSNTNLIVASILFAVVHFRYLKKPMLFGMVFGASVGLGLLFAHTGSLTACMIAHFLVNFVLGLMLQNDEQSNSVVKEVQQDERTSIVTETK